MRILGCIRRRRQPRWPRGVTGYHGYVVRVRVAIPGGAFCARPLSPLSTASAIQSTLDTFRVEHDTVQAPNGSRAEDENSLTRKPDFRAREIK